MVGKQLMGKVAFVFFINFLLALFNVHDLSRQELNLRGRWCQRKVFTMQLSKSLKSNYAFVKPGQVENVLFNEGTIKWCKNLLRWKYAGRKSWPGTLSGLHRPKQIYFATLSSILISFLPSAPKFSTDANPLKIIPWARQTEHIIISNAMWRGHWLLPYSDDKYKVKSAMFFSTQHF